MIKTEKDQKMLDSFKEAPKEAHKAPVQASKEAPKPDPKQDKQDSKQDAKEARQDSKQSPKPASRPEKRVSAEELAKGQREISVAEFFEKNRHLLGFDNPRKSLLTSIKEAVDNALDACEEARILPELTINVTDMGGDRFKVIVEDNGPGIVKAQIPKIFAKLLYGSKFHSLKQNRGAQGIGISASVMYAQLTTGRPARIWSKTAPEKPAHYFELNLDTQKNEPKILKEEERPWDSKDHGTKIELDLEASYLKGMQSVDEYLRQTAIVNPHATITYVNPKAEQLNFPRGVDTLPPLPKEIKPHPYGLELGILMKMLKNTKSRTLSGFMTEDLSRVGSGTAKEICDNARLDPRLRPQEVSMMDADKLIKAIKETKIMAPQTDCISPIGEAAFEKGIRKEVVAEYYCTVTRPPSVYRGNPFQIEVALAYGGQQDSDQATLIRFANRVPLLYQQGACAMTKSVTTTNWKSYGISQSNGSLPSGPLTIAIHMASVWVPYTSESKEALAHYPEIIKEIKLALQEAGRKLQMYVSKKTKIHQQLERASLFENYIPEVANALSRLTGNPEITIKQQLEKMVKKDEIQAVIHEMETLPSQENGDGGGKGDGKGQGPKKRFKESDLDADEADEE